MAQSDSDTFHPSGRAQPPTAPTSGLSTAPSSAVSRHSPGGFASSSNHPTSHLVSDIIEVLKPKHNNSTTDADASDSQSHTVAPPNVEFYDPLSPVGLAGKEGEGYRYQHIDPYPSKTEQPPTSASARSGMPPPSLFGTPPLAPPPTLLQTINTTNSPRRTTAPSVARVGSMQSWDSMDASNVGDSTAVAAAAPVPPRTQVANGDDEDAKSEETYEDDFVDDVYHSCDGSGNCGEVPSLFYSEKFLRESTAAAKEDEDYVFAQPPTTSKRFRKAETESAVAFSSAQLATEAQSAEDATAEDIEDEVELPSSQVDPPSLEDQQPSNSDFIGAAATSTASMVKTATTPTNTYRSSSPREKHTSAEASPSPSATDEFWHRTGTDNTGPQSTNVAVTSDVGSWFLGGGTMEGADTNPFGTEGNQISGQGSDEDADEDGMSASMRRALEVQMYTPFSVMSPSRPPTPSVPAPAESETMVSSASPETEIEPDEPLVQVQPAAASSKSSAKTKKGKKNKKGSVATTSASPSTPEKLKGSKVAHDEDGDDTPSAQPVSTPEPESGGEQFDWNEPRRNVAATAKWVQRLPQPTAGSSTVSSAFQTPEVSPFQPPTAPPKATVKAPKPINYSEPNSTPDAPTVQGDDGVEDFMLPPSNQPEPKPNPFLAPTSSGSAPRSGDSYIEPPLTKTQKKKNAKLMKALQIEAGEGVKGAEGADDDVDGQDKGNAGDDSLPTSIIKGLRSGAGRQATDDSSQSQEQVHAKGGNRPFYTPCTSSHPATPEISGQLTGSLSRQGTNTPPHGTVTAVGSPSNVKVSGSPNAETEDDADGKDWGEADTPETVSPATTSPSTTPPLKPKNPSGSASASSKGKGKKKKGRK
eukprot:GILJ01019587.1.p1 GENE.GILJ01019587.1~~GILJ01019587.1.p1  ORF type:complete len:935 (-),score=152.97 GILJ01019587.1:330-2936(-)